MSALLYSASLTHRLHPRIEHSVQTAETSRSPTAQKLAAAEIPGPRSPDKPHPGDIALPASHTHRVSPPLVLPPSRYTAAQTHQSRPTVHRLSGRWVTGMAEETRQVNCGATPTPCNAFISVSTSVMRDISIAPAMALSLRYTTHSVTIGY